MSSCPQSFAGITRPEGEPGALRAAAGQFGGLAGSLAGVGGELRGIPGALASWAGPASVSYAGACMTNGSACDTAVQALSEAQRAARVYADALEEAQRDAEAAIEDARDAQRRIDRALERIEAAQTRRAAAEMRAAAASSEISITALTGAPSPFAEGNLAAAQAEAADAAADEAAARRDLDQARDDLERAKRRGERAEEAARDAARAASGVFAAVALVSPVFATFGAPASGATASGGGSWWNTTNEGRQWWNEDQFASQLYPFHPKNDEFAQRKWFFDQFTGFGSAVTGAALTRRADALRRLAGTAVTTTTFARTFLHFQSPSRSLTIATQTITQTTTRPWASLGPTAAKYGKFGKAIPWVGTAIGFGSATVEQWRNDASNPNLTQTDRVGRAAGVGAYVTGAAAAGALVGTFIPIPGVGTVGGAAVGALVGLGMGAAASAWEPGKELAADIGQGIANGAVDTVNFVDDKLQAAEAKVDEIEKTVNDGIVSGAKWVGDKVTDIDLPSLPNPTLPSVALPDVDLPDIDVPDFNPF